MTQSEFVLAGAHILCVDDSPDAVELLRIILARQGAVVVTCASAEEAIENLQNRSFDVIVSDLSMPPGMSGYDLAHALRKMELQDPDRETTPTVAVSGDAAVPSGKRRFADFQVYMPKPFNKNRLVSVLNRLIEADGEAVRLGSLAIWEAKQATEAAEVATEAAATATAAAADLTSAAVKGKAAAAKDTYSAASAEMNADTTSSVNPR